MEGAKCTMAYEYDCPYLSYAKNGIISCEFAKITPPDTIARAEFLKEHCGHGTKYKECPFYKIMDDYYHRKYSTEVDKW